MSDPPILSQNLMGGLGNRMFEHLLARAILRRIPELRLTGSGLPEWGIRPPRLALPARHYKLAGHRVELERLAYLVRQGIVQGVETSALGCRMEYLESPQATAAVFPQPAGAARRFGPESLVISVRGAEVLRGVHKDYRPMPLAFYARLMAETGLAPVFLGQLGEDAYTAALRGSFPQAEFVPSQGAMADFASLRTARHLVLSTSTFAWLAAWMSEATVIHLPVAGMYHPQRRPELDLLPLADPRYRFHLMPPDPWTGSAADLHAAIEGGETGIEISRDAALQLAHPSVVLQAATGH